MADVLSNMSGTVIRVLVKPGDSVAADQDVVVLESMKMEMNVPSSQAGVVSDVKVAADDFVQEGQVLLSLK